MSRSPRTPARNGQGPPADGGEPALTGEWCAAVVDASPDGVLLVDAGTIVHVNRAVVEMSGWPAAELVGQGVEVLVPGELRDRHAELRSTFQQAPYDRPMGEAAWLSMSRADGSELPVEIALAPVRVAGRPMTLATVRDVSGRLREAAAHERLVQLLDLVPDSIIVVDLEDGRIEYVNEAASALLGYAADELVGSPTTLLRPEVDDPTARPDEEGEVLLADGGALRPGRLRARDGTVVECEVHSLEVESAAGGRVLVNVVRDVGDRLALERRLRDSEEYFRRTFDQAPVGIAVVRVDPDDTRTIVTANPAFTDMFGFEPDVLGGPDPDLRRAPWEGTSLASLARQMVAVRAGVTETRRLRRKDGSEFWADFRANEMDLALESGRLFLVHVVDVTARFDEERRARQQSRLTQCVADVARAALEHRPEDAVFERIATGALEVVDADAAGILLYGHGASGSLRWGAVTGVLAFVLEASLEATADAVVTSRIPATAMALPAPPDWAPPEFARQVGPVAMAPFGQVGSPPAGGIVVCRKVTGQPFTDGDLERLNRLATQTQIAVHLARARADQHRLTLLEERQRIARELHDTVIQDVIAVGMQISAEVDAESDPDRQARDLEKVAQLEGATRRLRQAVFELRSVTRHNSTATDLVELVTEAVRVLGHVPTVTFTGPVDSLPAPLADDLLAVVRESLANVARHAQATRTAIAVEVTPDTVTVTVDDDGVGMARVPRTGYGVESMADRARRHGGRLRLGRGPVVGTRLVWTCPREGTAPG